MRVLFSCFLVVLPNLSAWASCEAQSVKLGDAEFSVEVLRYQAAESRRHVVVIPPTGGTNMLDRSWGKRLCEAGLSAHILEHWTQDDEYALDLGIHQRFYQRTQRAIGLLLNDLPASDFVGILGTSIGGIHAAMAMGLHPRLGAAFVITAGARMHTMIAESDQQVMVEAWEKRREMFNISDKTEYARRLDGHIKYDAEKLPRHFAGKPLGMVVARGDTVVPRANQEVLRQLWRPETVIEWRFNHFLTIVWSWWWDRNRVINFFTQASAHVRAVSGHGN